MITGQKEPLSAFDQAWPLLKEYYPDDISDEDYEEAEYAQNPQWPHKNWMESPQWPQLCDFVIEGVDYNGCGRVIDGEEVTGLPMMSGQAMCHDCLRDVAGPPPKIVVQGTPKLEDDNWQDSIERGEPMNSFDRAWGIFKSLDGKSISYYTTLDKIEEVEKAMGWKPMTWHTILTNDDELLRYLEEQSQTDKYGPQYKAMMGAVLHSYMNDYDKGTMVEGYE
tara:strand:- start:1663 stop:2328 length:666 start_codon:yes stop_codon:yes gene_type:complete